VTAARTWSLDVRMRPLPSFDLSGAWTRTGPRIGTEASTTTRQAAATWRAGSRLQVSGTYSRSDQSLVVSGSSRLTGQEVYGARVATSVGRSITLKAATYQIDPRGENASRQWDFGLTKVFGR
jgi:hypothetical protein